MERLALRLRSLVSEAFPALPEVPADEIGYLDHT
jgi:hypothetical protein